MSEKDYYTNNVKEYYKNNKDVTLNKSKEYYINNKELILKYIDYQKQYRENNPLTEDKKQKMKEYQKEYKKNINDEQKTKNKRTSKAI